MKRKRSTQLAVRKMAAKPGWFQIFPWAWLCLAYLGIILFLYRYGRPYIDSDMASEMILADLLNQEGGWLSANWWYSTELRVFYHQPFYRLGLLLFPENWHAARMMGQAMLLMLLLLSYIYAARGVKLKNWGVWGAAALASPFGVWYLWYGPFGGAYLPHMILVLLSFGAIQHLLHTHRMQKIPHILILLAAGCGSGLNGVKGLMGFYLPMFVSAAAILAVDWHQNGGKCPVYPFRQVLYSGLALIAAAAGYLVNSVVLSRYYHFADYNGQTWNHLSLQNLVEQWSNFLSLFGFPGDRFLNPKIPLFSICGILGAMGVLTAAAVCIALVRLFLRWGRLKEEQRIIPALFAGVCLIQGMIFTWTGRPEEINGSYWLTVMPLTFYVLQLEGETEDFRIPHGKQVAALAFSCCVVATSISALLQFFTAGYRINPQLETVCDELMNRGYTQGYATFWNGNVMTEWSSGEIDMWVTWDFHTMEPYQWLQKTSHTQPPEGEVFLLTTYQELNQMGLSWLLEHTEPAYEHLGWGIFPNEQQYVVFCYPSYEEMMTVIQSGA